MKKIKIAIDISPTQNSNSQRGVGYYTSRLVSAIQSEISTNLDYKNWSLQLITDNSSLLTGFDLVHYPYFDPFFLTLPIQKHTPIIVTVHDLVPRLLRSLYPVGLKGEIKWLIQKNRLAHINHIITDSHTAKYQICAQTGISAAKITTIYLAADSSFLQIKNKSILNLIRQKYKLPSKFVMYLGDINLNKNIPMLVRSCLDLNIHLVIIGAAAVNSSITNHPWTQDIIWLQKQASPYLHLLGFVPDVDLPPIFNLATLYCQPSLAEGFGLAILQAMQSGCPTIYSKNTSLEEISLNSGLSFDPYSSTDLTAKINLLYNSSPLQNKYRLLGLTRAKSFSWSQTAKQTLATYQLCLL